MPISLQYNVVFLSVDLARVLYFFFFNDTATTEIYTLSLHDALPICHLDTRVEHGNVRGQHAASASPRHGNPSRIDLGQDRKSTRLNSSHANISYAVFCLKKKKRNSTTTAPMFAA